jgi:phosphocarrier protein HPr
MVSQSVIVVNKTGIHARPATNLIKEAAKYMADISIKFNNAEYNAKSMLMVLGAGIRKGAEIEIVCNGSDESTALNNIVKLIESGMGE